MRQCEHLDPVVKFGNLRKAFLVRRAMLHLLTAARGHSRYKLIVGFQSTPAVTVAGLATLAGGSRISPHYLRSKYPQQQT